MTTPPRETPATQSQPMLTFWYEPASTYSYPAAMRIEALARDAGVGLIWKPFLLGPIFKREGYNTSPFRVHRDKGVNMVRDLQRLCALHELPPFQHGPSFPVHSVLAARALIAAGDAIALATRALYMAQFAKGEDIADAATVGQALDDVGLDGEALLALAQTPDIKQKLRDNTEEAMGLGVYGAPSFTTDDGELFWGHDRMEQALQWAKEPWLAAKPLTMPE